MGISLIGLVVLLQCCFNHALPTASTNTTGRDRYAVIKSYSLTGVKNVRWETTPMNYVDAKGNPMPNKVAGTKNEDGTTVFGCLDASGKNQPHGSEYERPSGKFKYRCNNGMEEVVACVGSERANKARIDVGQTLDVNGFWHKCQSFPNQSVVYTQEPSCSFGGKEIRVAEEISAGNLRLECMESGYKVVGCYFQDDNNNVVKLNSGETREAGKVVHHCEEKNDTLQYYSKSSGCTKSDKEYKEGEMFSQNHLKYKCSNGMADVTGCYVNDTKELAIGNDLVENQMVYRCYRLGGKIEYSEYACGFNGTPSCTPEPIPQTPDDVPQLGRGLQAPGFGSFAVVQRVGGSDVVASPSNLKLDMDKSMASHQ